MPNSIIITPTGKRPIITGRGRSKVTINRRPQVPVSSTPEWEILRDFNSGTVGTAANGTADGFDSAALRSLYTTEQAFEGTQACKVQMLVTDGTGFGEYGGIVSFPAEAFAGDTVWLDVMLYFGDDFDLDAARLNSKLLRIRTETAASGNAGYIDLYLSTGIRSAFMFQAIKEGIGTWYTMGVWEDLTKNTWHRITLHYGLGAVAQSSGGTAFLKVWRNGSLLLNSPNFVTLSGADNKATDFYCFTQWNNGVTVDQACFIDRIRMAKNGVPSWAVGLEGAT